MRLQPNSPAGLKNLAAAYALAGQFDRSVEAADAALRLNPAEPLASEIRRQRALSLQRKTPLKNLELRIWNLEFVQIYSRIPNS